MTEKKPVNAAASVLARLKNVAKNEKKPAQAVYERYAMERFLYRLSKSSFSDKLALKGALMLVVWDAPKSRPTRDIDVLGRDIENDIDVIVGAVKNICDTPVDPDDGVMFDTTNIRADDIDDDSEYHGIRVRFSSHIGSAQLSMQLDIGFGDVVKPRIRTIGFPSILGPGPFKLRGYPVEAYIAEKFQAMHHMEMQNSRSKDFYDLWYISTTMKISGENLCDAVKSTFQKRETAITDDPRPLTEEFARDGLAAQRWGPYIKTNELASAPEAFRDVQLDLREFLIPVCQAIVAGQTLNSVWHPNRGWVDS